jgi:hypothetical protein
MRVLIAVPVCYKYALRLSAIRETWGRDVQGYPNLTIRYFYGDGEGNLDGDTVLLHVPSDYEHLSERVIAIVRYAYENGYDWVLKADDDTYIDIPRLCLERPSDYAGRVHGTMCFGGSAYWLSRKSMDCVAKYIGPLPTQEDRAVGMILACNGIIPSNLIGHCSGCNGSPYYFPNGFNPRRLDVACAHKVRPEEMHQWFKETHLM